MQVVAPILSVTIGNVPTTGAAQSVHEGIELPGKELEAYATSEIVDLNTDAAANPISLPSSRFDIARPNFLDRDAAILALARRMPSAIVRMLKPDLRKPWPIAFVGAGILLARMEQQQRMDFLGMVLKILRSERVAGRPLTIEERMGAIRLSLKSLTK